MLVTHIFAHWSGTRGQPDIKPIDTISSRYAAVSAQETHQIVDCLGHFIIGSVEVLDKAMRMHDGGMMAVAKCPPNARQGVWRQFAG